MLHITIFEPAQSEWALSVAVPPNSRRISPFYANYRKLEADSVNDAYPIFVKHEGIDALGEALICSILYANYGFCHIRIDEWDSSKTLVT